VKQRRANAQRATTRSTERNTGSAAAQTAVGSTDTLASLECRGLTASLPTKNGHFSALMRTNLVRGYLTVSVRRCCPATQPRMHVSMTVVYRGAARTGGAMVRRRHRRPRTMSMILHRSKSLWKKWHTTCSLLVTSFRNSSSLISLHA
jgi:hypothetical protein